VTYAGVKGAYISTVFGTYVVERNVIYLTPLLFIATALAFARGIGRGWAIAGAGLFTLVVVARTPLHLDFPYYEAHGFSIATLANRELGMSKELIEGVLIGIAVVALLVVVALKLVRPRSTAFTAIAASAAVVVLAWGLTGQVYAAEGERDFSEFPRRRPAQAERLGAGGDARRVGRRPRPADHGRDEHLADGVLQPVGQVDVVARRKRAEGRAGPSSRLTSTPSTEP
jgi:hypothetical protein